MSNIFCCSSIKPYRPRQLDHESKFSAFMKWTSSQSSTASIGASEHQSPSLEKSTYVVQVVRQINFGALEGKRYFELGDSGVAEGFVEVTERQLIDANFQKLNSYKNFKCTVHNKFFELNLYQKDPVNKHHWRANIARPASNIDILKNDKKSPETSSGHVIGRAALVDVKTEVVHDGSSGGDGGENEMARESDRNIKNSVDKSHTDNDSSKNTSESLNQYEGATYEGYYGRERDWSPSPRTGGDDFTACSADDWKLWQLSLLK
ncbi:hypothetical protein IFR05_001938 [Cadophora sp. M221]|nr:hypothetical protein IFR05_001938 [Cadophora sp. M221]